MKYTLLFLTSLACYSQTPTITLSGSSTTRPGQSITISVAHDIPAAAAVQWTMLQPAGWIVSNKQAGPAAINKTLSCSPPPLTKCIVAGLNVSVMPTGELSTITFSVPPAAATGQVQMGVHEMMAANAAGDAVAVSAGPPLSIMVLQREDLNGDGLVDATDLSLLVDQVVGKTSCTNDLNGDAKCTVLDVLRLVRVALGL